MRAEKRLAAWLLVLAILFIGADVVFLFFHGTLFAILEELASGLTGFHTALSPAMFFLALTNAMMVMLIAIAISYWRNPEKNRNLIPVFLISKLTSSVTGLVMAALFFQPVYLVIPVVDLSIFTIVWVLYRATLRGVGNT